jgi:hypothetical protein
MSEVARLLEQHAVKVWGPGGEVWALRSLDVIHDELHLTVGPMVPRPWVVVVVDGDKDGRGSYVGRDLAEALALASPVRGMEVSVWEVRAPDAAMARLGWSEGQCLLRFSWSVP